MLYSAELRLSVTEAPESSNISGYHILSLFLHLIQKANPALAAELHSDSSVKPFTLSPLLPLSLTRKSVWKEGENISFRVTALDERVFTTLADVIWRLSPETELPLGDTKVRCHSLATTPEQSPWANFSSFKQLKENAETETKLRMTFLTATTFRSKGKRNVLFPEPSLVFSSLINRWNGVADADDRLSLDETTTSLIRISNYRLATRLLNFGSYQELGFSGNVTYECSENLSREQIMTLNALADFAFYAGVGAKTTMGMGQCHRS